MVTVVAQGYRYFSFRWDQADPLERLPELARTSLYQRDLESIYAIPSQVRRM
jgi:hypothetical protein